MKPVARIVVRPCDDETKAIVGITRGADATLVPGTVYEIVKDTAYSNCLTSAPLTAAGIEAAITNVMDRHGRSINVKPDTMYLPVGFVEQRMHEAIVWCERLIRKLGERVVTGTQAQRRRRKAQGVVGRRHLRRLELRQELIRALDYLAFWESAGVEI